MSTLKLIEKYRSNLLDLTLRNRLLNIKLDSKSLIRIIDEDPSYILGKLLDEKRLEFRPIEEPSLDQYEVENAEDSESKKKPDIRKFARSKGIDPNFDLAAHLNSQKANHNDLYIQTLFYPEDLERTCTKIYGAYRTGLEETGNNLLYLTFLTLEYFPSDEAEKPSFAPLIVLQVEMDRKPPDLKHPWYRFSIKATDSLPETNISLLEKLRAAFSIALPQFSQNEDSEPGSDLLAFKELVESVLKPLKPKWRVNVDINLTTLNFAKLVMYRDLEAAGWVAKGKTLSDHPLIKHLCSGEDSGANEALQFSNEEYNLDELKPNEYVEVIYDADSSQHHAILDVNKGKNLVIEGPPGTGKSQTITNIIASALSSGKKVLFVAEKLAALKVVKERLDHAGVGIFALELHSTKAHKRTVLDDIERRRKLEAPRQLAVDAKAHTHAKNTLNKYIRALHDSADGESLYHLIGRSLSEETALAGLIPSFEDLESSSDLGTLDEKTVLDITVAAKSFGKTFLEAFKDYSDLNSYPWLRVNVKQRKARSDLILSQLQNLRSKLERSDALLNECFSQNLSPIQSVVVNELLPFLDWLEKQSVHFEPTFIHAFIKLLGLQDARSSSLEARFQQLQAESRELSGRGVQSLILSTDSPDLAAFVIALTKSYPRTTGLTGGQITSVKTVVEADLKSAKTFVDRLNLHTQFGLKSDSPLSVLQQASKVGETLISLVESDFEGIQYARTFLLSFPPTQGPSVEKAIARISEIGNEISDVLSPQVLSFHSSIIWKHIKTLERTNWLKKIFFSEDKAATRWLREIARTNTKEPSKLFPALYKAHNQACELEALYDRASSLKEKIHDRVSRLPWHSTAKAIQTMLACGNKLSELQIDANKWMNSLEAENGLQMLFAQIDGQSTGKLLERLISAMNLIGDSNQSVVKFDKILSELGTFHSALANLCSFLGFRTFDKVLISDASGTCRLLLDHLRSRSQVASLLSECGLIEYLSDLDPIKWSGLISTRESSRVFRAGKLGPYFQAPDMFLKLSEEFSVLRAAKTELQQALQVSDSDVCAFTTIGTETIGKSLENTEACSREANLLPKYLELVDHEVPVRDQPGFSQYFTTLKSIRDIPLTERYLAYRALRNLVDRRLSTHEHLSRLSAEELSRLQSDFRALDLKTIEANRGRTIQALANVRVPAGSRSGNRSTWTDECLLVNEIAKEKRHIPIRRLMERASAAILALKPCFMMSPLSVAQFLPPGIEFDLIIMDEASQMRTEDALGAIARGRQLVIVGDTKQMPPSSFFEQSDGQVDEEMAEEQFESVLEQAAGVFRPARRLKWHYRSQHQSLIAFSNAKFYGNDLIIFPTSKSSHDLFGVKFNRVSNGIYQGKGINTNEAEAVVKKLKEHVKNDSKSSVAIVTMNIHQKELIEDMLLQESKSDPLLGAFLNDPDRKEPLLLQNLENVQGHERDVVFISVTYGPDPTGVFHLRFGPINQTNGQRRLNVLFSRARKRMEVFCSFDPAKLDGANAEGAKTLGGFLKFAESGQLPFDVLITNKAADSPFEIEVAEAIRSLGFEIEPQVGVAGYFLDLAVKCRTNPNQFLLGVECDGATYHSARSARDRDRLREENLRKLGWDIYRIWSADWFRNRKSEIQRLDAYLKRAAQKRALNLDPDK